MKIALFGDRGMLGHEFTRSLGELKIEHEGFNRSNFELVTPVGALARKIEGYDVVLNCIAYTGVDTAEANQAEAFDVNSDFPGRLAEATTQVGKRLIHFSTDYVFDGKADVAFRVHSPRNPQNVYGQSKTKGEELIEGSGGDFAIVRTAWLYGAFGKCFPKTIANLVRAKGHVSVVNDQIGNPTWTKDLVNLTLAYIESGKKERHIHGVSSGAATWFDFAREIVNFLGIDADSTVRAVSSEAFPTPASRPSMSCMDNSNGFGFQIGDWATSWRAAAPDVIGDI
jgi:dTDP-4-dehydrorhamnose reductase